MLGHNENANFLNIIGCIFWSFIIFLVSCLGENIYAGVLIGILSACLVGVLIHYINYINERNEFILYTRGEIKNILTQIIDVKLYLRAFSGDISPEKINNRDKFEKIQYLNWGESILKTINELSNSINLLNSKILRYDDLSIFISYLVISTLKIKKLDKIIPLWDRVFENSFNRNMEYLLNGIYSEIKDVPNIAILMAYRLVSSFLDLKLCILKFIKDGGDEDLFKKQLRTMLFELGQQIDSIDNYFLQRIDGIKKVMGLFSHRTVYAEYWNSLEKELDAVLSRNDSPA